MIRRCLFLTSLLAATLLPQTKETPPRDLSVTQLSWMTGCWAMTRGPVTIEEQWGKPAADTMLGFSRTLKGRATLFSEFMRIENSNGRIVYVARIGTRQPATPFPL